LKQGIKVVDVSADFRLNNPKEFEEWYKVVHPVPELLGKAVYGLPELNREKISQAKLIANPGCYAASIILALAPAVKEGLIENDIVVDSKSGVSGAGRTLNLTTHFAEANESVSAYALDGHRHLPEIVQELGKGLINQAPSSGKRLSVTFLPHIVPMTRGILSSCYAKLAREVTKEEIIQIYQDFYRDEPFTRVVGYSPATKQTLGTNLCFIHPTVDLRTNRLIVISVLDNLIKGGAGQAIQNMNLMFGFPETTRLEGLALYP
jgi:N-acetyl-gamma-glutamyl-phosphate reductase